MNKSILLYSTSRPRIRDEYESIWLNDGLQKIYVRAEVVDGGLLVALAKAKPRRGERVLNSVPLG